MKNVVIPDIVNRLERFQAKWKPVRVQKTRQIKNLEPRFDSIETEKAPALQVLEKLHETPGNTNVTKVTELQPVSRQSGTRKHRPGEMVNQG